MSSDGQMPPLQESPHHQPMTNARKPIVLFLCGHNSCRSQMAEGILRHLAADSFEAMSAGVAEKPIHPLTAKAMAEIGIDISGQRSKLLADAAQGRTIDCGISVCAAADQNCPVWYGPRIRIRWHFDDPASAAGTEEQQMAMFRRVRDEIHARITEWLGEVAGG